MSNCGFLSGPDVGGTIQNQLSSIMGMGNESYSTAMAAMSQMAVVFQGHIAEVGAWSPATPGVGATDSINFITPAPLPTRPNDTFNLPDIPSVESSGLDDLNETLAELLDELRNIIGQIPTFDNLDIDDRFLSLLDTYYTQLSSRLRGVLDASPTVTVVLERLDEWLQPGSIGMDADVERALRDRGLADIDREERRQEQDASADWLARGFSFPAGVLDAKLARIRTDANDKRSALNRDILIEAAKWEQETRRFAIEKGLAYDTVVRDSFFKVYEQSRTIAATWQENHIKARLAAVEVYKAQVSAFSEAARALESMGSTAATAIRARLDQIRLRIERFDAVLRAEVATKGFDVQLYGEDIRLHGLKIQAENERVGTLGRNDERLLRREEIDANTTMKARELEMHQLIETARVSVTALDGIARTASQLSGGVFSALHMSAGISASSSYSNSSSCSTSYSYSYKG